MDPSSSAWFLTQGYLLMIAGALAAGSVMAAAVMYQLYFMLFNNPGGESEDHGSVCSKSNWPPSPPALPILGHLHLLKGKPHHDMYELCLNYGPLYHLRLGSTHALVISSASMAKEALKIHDKTFASRVSNGASVEIFSHNYQDLAGAPYGPHWRHMRKLCLLELFSSKRIDSFAHLRDEETCSLIRNLNEESVDGKPIVVSLKFAHTSLNIISLMTMGKRLIKWGCSSDDDDDHHHGEDEAELTCFQEIIREVFALCGVINNFGDYFPCLRRLDLQGYERRMKNACNAFDAFVFRMIALKQAEKRERPQSVEHHKDLLDVLLSLPNETNGKLSDDMVTGTMLNIIAAGVDTSSTTIEWAVTELVREPEKLKTAQEEIDAWVGKDRKVEESDLQNFVYLDAIVKETFRLHPPAPLLLPHESIEACRFQGYDIPAKTRLYVNVWAIGRDPSSWDKPLDFFPERFLVDKVDIDVRGQNFELLPFGSGRRMCPGMTLGLVVTKLTLARLLHSFDIALPPWQRAEDLDMSESFGLTLFKTKPLQLTLKGRLPKEIY